jgi:hypothetical protein
MSIMPSELLQSELSILFRMLHKKLSRVKKYSMPSGKSAGALEERPATYGDLWEEGDIWARRRRRSSA